MSTGRAGATAGDRPSESSGPTPGGLGTAGSAVVGSALMAFGLRRRSLVGTAAALAGGWLVYRAVGGRGGTDRSRAGGGGGVSARERDASEAGASDAGGGADETAVTRSVTVGVSPDEAYESWNDSETQARVFGGFADVTPAGEGDWRWEVDAPFGRSVAWETRTVEDRPGELVRWESSGGAAAVVPEGSVRFRPAPGDRGTEVTLRLRVAPPGGSLGRAALERLGVVPRTLASEVLYRFKSLVETGEIPTLEGNPSGRGRGDLL